jgi:hypothetical protein
MKVTALLDAQAHESDHAPLDFASLFRAVVVGNRPVRDRGWKAAPAAKN